MKNNRLIVLCVVALMSLKVSAQLEISSEIRPRFEYRNGYKTLIPNNVNPATYISQRSRLMTNFKSEGVNVYLSLQDIRVWGDVSQLNSADNNGLAIHQAWADIKLKNKFFAKVGRQEIILDDHRIFGSVNWAQQARSHDAAVFKFKSDSFKVDLGIAYNQNSAMLTGNTYTVPKNYKAMQYLWLHKDWKKFSASFLALNNGTQSIDTSNASNNSIQYSQTVGTHLKLKAGKFSFMSNLYYQFGKDVNKNSINAYLVALETTYKVKKSLSFTLGAEQQSGNDNATITNSENKAFSPLYGTNHKFNGLMDYFYVGNHANSVGLTDIYLSTKIGIGKKTKIIAAVHNFSTAASLPVNGKAALGNEVDLVWVQKIRKGVGFKLGYSHMFAQTGMEELKGVTDRNTNNWGWAMLTVKPTLFKSKSAKK